MQLTIQPQSYSLLVSFLMGVVFGCDPGALDEIIALVSTDELSLHAEEMKANIGCSTDQISNIR